LEWSLYILNAFITLTYNSDFLPRGLCGPCSVKREDYTFHAEGSICPQAPVLFMKRLRRKFGDGIRSYGCAEYGLKNNRPHYHILLFNFDFPDKVPWKKRMGNQYYLSESLKSLWSHPKSGESFGFTTTAGVSFESAAYVARYVTKKVTGAQWKRDLHYCGREPEQAVCRSMAPGVGRPWLDKNMSDVYPDDFLVMNGKTFKPPLYYDRRFEIEFPEEFAKVKERRQEKLAEVAPEELEWDRMRVKEYLQLCRFKQLARRYENEE